MHSLIHRFCLLRATASMLWGCRQQSMVGAWAGKKRAPHTCSRLAGEKCCVWQVRLSWPGVAGGSGGSCSSNIQWPALEGLLLLGVSGVNPVTLTMQVGA